EPLGSTALSQGLGVPRPGALCMKPRGAKKVPRLFKACPLVFTGRDRQNDGCARGFLMMNKFASAFAALDRVPGQLPMEAILAWLRAMPLTAEELSAYLIFSPDRYVRN